MSNRITRILVAVVAIPLLLFITYLGKIPFLIFVLGIGLISFYELSLMMRNKNIFLCTSVGYLSVILVILNSYFRFFKMDLLFISLLLILMLVELFRNKGSAINNISTTLFAVLYSGIFSSTVVGIREFYVESSMNYNNGGALIISILITLWMTDSAAYFIGTAIGKHKLFPRVSPKKSWEGAIAGFVFAVITVVVLKTIFVEFLTWQDAVVIGLIVGIFGQLGDLVESLVKRDSGVKDSSQIIPGHGGILDRFDSLLFAAPLVFLYLRLF